MKLVKFHLLNRVITTAISMSLSIAYAQSSSTNIGEQAQAQNQSSMKVEGQSSSTNKGFHSTLQLSRSSNFYKEGTADNETSTDLLINPSYSLSEQLSIAAKSTLSHDETKAKDTTLSNTSISLKIKGPQISDNTQSNFVVGGLLPTNTENKKTERLQGGAILGTSVSNTLLNLTTTYALILQRNFHEYTVNADGRPNVQYSLKHDLTLEYAFSDLWSISADGIYKNGWTYKNFERHTFATEIDLNYNVNKQLSISVGLANEGNALKPNGTESNISVYDENTSKILASVTFVN